MSHLSQVYRHSLALLTDLYQLTMAYAYWKSGAGEKEAVFHLFFRKNPFEGRFSIACGLATAVEFLKNFHLDTEDIGFLAGLRGNDGKPLFEQEFLDYLAHLELDCDIDGIPEGTVVFPHEPLLRVRGPIIPCQILETTLLNMLNFQTLVATKAARVCRAARGDPVLEFGLRRAQGIDGALSASRAAYVGGCAATSNVLAGKIFGIPVRGTHAHSWVMAFDEEREAFEAYARAMPNNCVFLVDTYDTLEGVRKAAQVGQWLRKQGHEMAGIRLDSGDLAALSQEARKILDDAGFPRSAIIASNDLDEHLIASLKAQGAAIAVWGVGTKLVTGYDQPALGGVYKLSAVRRPGQPWQYRVKVSQEEAKTSNPGILQVRRFHTDRQFLGDAIYDVEAGLRGPCVLVECEDTTRRREFPEGAAFTDLLVPVFRGGRAVYDPHPLSEARQRAKEQIDCLYAGFSDGGNSQTYPVGLEKGLYELRNALVSQTRR